MPAITADVRAIIDATHLCFAATVSATGRPNLSPKGTIRVWDDDAVFYLDIASPQTRANLERSPYIELNVVDQLSRRGYRITGRASLHREDDVYRVAMDRIRRDQSADYPVHCVVLVHVERVGELVSPGYLHVASEAEMRSTWVARRRELEAEFERHVRTMPFVPSRRSAMDGGAP